MAKPRVFISSTFYDLRVVRNDLERFVKELGYEPVLFESGHVPYGKDDALEEYCYREINGCDIVITIIGGKYGTQSQDQKNSITQKELKTAIELGKQIYVFVEKAVLNEFRTYELNSHLDGFKTFAVNDVRVYTFLKEIYNLQAGNPIEGFETSADITRFLKEQWAGLFQRLLQESVREKEYNLIESLQATTTTLNNLVTYLSEEKTKGTEEAINNILLLTHPAFQIMKKIIGCTYPIVFYTVDDLKQILSERNFFEKEVHFLEDYRCWEHDTNNVKTRIKVDNIIFEGNKLKIFTPDTWNNEWINYEIIDYYSNDDDLPF